MVQKSQTPIPNQPPFGWCECEVTTCKSWEIFNYRSLNWLTTQDFWTHQQCHLGFSKKKNWREVFFLHWALPKHQGDNEDSGWAPFIKMKKKSVSHLNCKGFWQPLKVCSKWFHMCHGQKSRFFGDGHPTFNRNPYFMGIYPYYWVDDHPLLYGNNGSLDPGTYEIPFALDNPRNRTQRSDPRFTDS